MRLKSTMNGTWPAGCHWVAGEVREIKVEKSAVIPEWLVEVKPPKKASKKASAEG